MILKDSVQIHGSPDRVWAFIEDPQRMKSWNPKIQSIVSISWGQRTVGYQYRITYAMSGKTSDFLAEFVEYRRPEKLVVRLSEGRLPRGAAVHEIYELSPNREGTLLQQRVEFLNSGVNIFLRLLIAFICRFGKPTGQTYLEKLKELVEAPA